MVTGETVTEKQGCAWGPRIPRTFRQQQVIGSWRLVVSCQPVTVVAVTDLLCAERSMYKKFSNTILLPYVCPSKTLIGKSITSGCFHSSIEKPYLVSQLRRQLYRWAQR